MTEAEFHSLDGEDGVRVWRPRQRFTARDGKVDTEGGLRLLLPLSEQSSDIQQIIVDWDTLFSACEDFSLLQAVLCMLLLLPTGTTVTLVTRESAGEMASFLETGVTLKRLLRTAKPLFSALKASGLLNEVRLQELRGHAQLSAQNLELLLLAQHPFDADTTLHAARIAICWEGLGRSVYLSYADQGAPPIFELKSNGAVRSSPPRSIYRSIWWASGLKG